MKAESATYTQTGGFIVGRYSWLGMYGTWPFAQLQVYRDHLVLRALFRKYAFPRDKLMELSIYRGVFTVGLRIKHLIEKYPRFVVYWSFNVGELCEHLRAEGYSVSDADI